MATKIDDRFRLARLLALIVPLGLLGGAYSFQYLGGLYPCEMCWWQRYPLFAAAALALLAFVIAPRRLWVALAALAILSSGLIGGFHAGVEWKWWPGITSCAAVMPEGRTALEAIMAQPTIRCDEAAFRLLGLSLAGWNFVISTLATLAILGLLVTRRRA